MKQSRTRRRRGVLLTSVGLKRLQKAIEAVEVNQNNGEQFTLQELSARMNVSIRTLSRLWSLNASVDRRTLKQCFSAFDLEICTEDYTISNEMDEDETTEGLSYNSDTKEIYALQSIGKDTFANEQHHKFRGCCLYPDGLVPLDSVLYIERPPVEKLGYQEITQPGCVIRICAPRQMGKSSLVLRLCAFAQQQEYYTVKLDCNQIDALFLSDLNLFFRHFCWRVAKELGIAPNLDAYWDSEIDSKLNCNFYWKNYLLEQIKRPIVLVLEHFDRFFEYPQIAQEFFPLLRSWYEEARVNTNWQKLRLVVVYSTQVYASLDINCSPFNIGLALYLSDFTQQQVKELAQRHGLSWNSGKEAAQLMSLVGGHPALIQMSLYYLTYHGMTLEELVEDAIANGGIYRNHLLRQWTTLQENPSLIEAYTKVVAASESVYLNPIQAYKLDCLGLICYEGSRISPRCELYRAYFKKQLSTIVALHNRNMMQCPECGSTTVSKNVQRKGKQNYLCQVCQRQFIDTYEPKGYTPSGQRHLNLVYR